MTAESKQQKEMHHPRVDLTLHHSVALLRKDARGAAESACRTTDSSFRVVRRVKEKTFKEEDGCIILWYYRVVSLCGIA